MIKLVKVSEMKSLTFFVGIGAFLISEVSAQLEFEKKSLHLKAEFGQLEIPAKFRFQNASDKPVTITKIQTSCGCLKALSNAEIYQHGEEGTIEVVFSTAGRKGIEEKVVTVSTDSQTEPTARLTVSVEIPTPIQIEPEMTSWSMGEKPTPKTVTLTILQPTPIKVTKASSSRKAISVSTKVIEEGRKYEFQLTPLSTEKRQLGFVHIETDSGQSDLKRILFFFKISK